jgi:soluble lytic murein transglycosylase-like protein
MGQIEQESRCNEGITAFDGGMGLGQFMPDTADWIHAREAAIKEFGIDPQPYNPRWAIRALMLYNRWLYKETDCEGWYYTFRAYNGGLGNINKEIRLADSCDSKIVERHCKRRLIRLKSGMLDLCKVNIEYPYLIFEKAEKYRRQ